MEHDVYTVAIHEAGHAVMSVIQGRKLEYVTIVSQDGGLGKCQNGDETPNKIETNEIKGLITRREVLILSAGTIAEILLLGIQPKDTRGADDFKKIEEILSNYQDKSLIPMLRQNANNTAFQIIGSPIVQQQIKSVADALMQQKTLSGEQVKQIMKEVGEEFNEH